MPLLPKLNKFDPNYDDITSYQQKLQTFFDEHDLQENKKKTAIFLTVVGKETYSLLRQILAPELPSTKTVDELCGKLKDHSKEQTVDIFERYKFYVRKQHDGESIADYITDLRKLSAHCDFKSFLDEALRDKFICGLNNANIRERLMAHKQLTIDTAVELAKNLEITENEILRAEKLSRLTRRVECYRCNSEHHSASECRFRNTVCYKCNTKGHLGKMCNNEPLDNEPRSTPQTVFSPYVIDTSFLSDILNITENKTTNSISKNESQNDSIISVSHNDSIISASQNDSIISVSHNDSIISASHNDTIISASHNGAIISASHNDAIISASHNDAIISASHNDAIISASHNDAIISASHTDAIISASLSDLTTSESQIERTRITSQINTTSSRSQNDTPAITSDDTSHVTVHHSTSQNVLNEYQQIDDPSNTSQNIISDTSSPFVVDTSFISDVSIGSDIPFITEHNTGWLSEPYIAASNLLSSLGEDIQEALNFSPDRSLH